MTTLETMTSAAKALAAARAEYDDAEKAWGEVQAARRELAGPGWDQEGVASILKKLAPLVAKYGAAFAGGGGLLALAADQGGFKQFLESLAGVFGG